MVDVKAVTRRIAIAGLIMASMTAHAVSSQHDPGRYQVPKEKLESFLSDHVADDFSGTILIVQNGKTLHAKGYGLANRTDNIPNALNTVFQTGALTRYFTATAILKLVEQNKLALDDKLGEFFDNVPENKQNVTIHHLLTHTSGLVDQDDVDAFEAVDAEALLEDVFSKSNSVKPAFYLPTWTFEPGDRVINFSKGYNLLALIIEQRSGQSFETFLNDQLFKPAGIKNTGYQLPDWKPEQLADGYVGENRGTLVDRLADKKKLPLYLQGSMGLMSTVEDLYAWHQALYAGKILRDDLVELLNTRHIGVATVSEADVDYGYGIYLSETWRGTPWIFNLDSSVVRNNLPGFTVGYHYFPTDNAVIIFASNGEISRELVDVKNMLIRVLLEPGYEPAAISVGIQQ